MNRIALAVAATVAIAGLAPGSPVTGQAVASDIQRCLSSDGSTLYTDQPCAALGAEPAAIPAALHARLDDARDAEMGAGGYVDASLSLHPATASVPSAIARRSPAAGCARTPTQLAMDLQGAFALGDVNRIAESYHWVGMEQPAATAVMERLERLGRSTVVDTRYYDASIASSGIGSWASAGPGSVSGSGVMQLTLGGEGGAAVVDFDVERYEGCYFVRF